MSLPGITSRRRLLACLTAMLSLSLGMSTGMTVTASAEPAESFDHPGGSTTPVIFRREGPGRSCGRRRQICP